MTRNNENMVWAIASAMCIIIWMTIVMLGIRSCNYTEYKDKGCSKGATREGECPAGTTGRVIELCDGESYKESFNSCSAGACTETVFDRDLQPIIQNKCVSCHVGFDTLDVAKGRIDQYIARISKADGDGQRMPKAPNPPLPQNEKDVFTKWKADGLLPACADNAANPHTSLNDLEEAALKDINSLNSGLQTETRWLYIASKSNEGANKKILDQFSAAVQKGINSMSLGRTLVLAKNVGANGTLLRFNLNDLKLNASAWALIEKGDPINLESNTNIGVVLKGLTKTKKPMMSVEAFLTSAFRADIYYGVRKIPSDLNTFLGIEGVNENTQIDNFQALFLGMIGDIALNKQRLLVRFDSNNGFFWQSFDSNLTPAVNKNLEQFPLLKATDPKNNYQFDASEVLFTLPNGLMGHALFAANGKRADFAPLDTVAHNVKPPADPTIRIQSCSRCHAIGLIPKTDTIRAKVDANAINFDLADVDKVDLLYRDPGLSFSDDNNSFSSSLGKLGILPTDTDPISLGLDNLQERALAASAVASFLLLTEEEFKDGLSRSADARAQVGGLLNGGTISFDVFKAVLPVLIRDLRLGQNPL